MPETHQAELNTEPRQSITIVDPEPLESTRLFKHISDEIWRQKPERYAMADFRINSVLPELEALELANEAIGAVDGRLVIAGGEGQLVIKSLRAEEAVFSEDAFSSPSFAGLTTFNWDQSWTYRPLIQDGKRTSATFTDGHLDFARELSADFGFDVDGDRLVISYAMQRYQYRQDTTTDLSCSAWYSKFAETGYEGPALHRAEMTEAQETAVLLAFAKIGGIAVDEFTARKNS